MVVQIHPNTVTVLGMDLRDDFHTVMWPDPKRGPYVAQIRMGEIAGRWEVLEVAIGSVKDTEPVTGATMRVPRLSALASEFASQITATLAANEPGIGQPRNAAEMDEQWHEARAPSATASAAEDQRVRDLIAHKAGVKRYPTDHLKKVAEVYTRAFEARQRPTKAVKEAFGLTTSAAANQVLRARDAGLLPKTPKGKANAATPTKKTQTRKRNAP
jgi:hypothetical protein